MRWKIKHEIRDSIHGFIKIMPSERKILDSYPLQRLRDINQLALTYLLYPSATHKRFEHSLGVMELATNIYDVVTSSENLQSDIESSIPEIKDKDKKRYWRYVLRFAALCHDVGHLPFSHAGEKELFPKNWNHERMTATIIEQALKPLLEEIRPPVKSEDVVKIAIGPKKMSKIDPNCEFNIWETILSEIIAGDCLGADRMDYLLRDSHHLGVVYGKFGHFRLVDTMRIITDPESLEPKLGIEIGGLHVVESLLLARYFMYSQIYFHHIRRIYDFHLKKFMKEWLLTNKNTQHFPTKVQDFLFYNDSFILTEILKSFRNKKSSTHEHARRIIERDHYKLVYERSKSDLQINPNAIEFIYNSLKDIYKEENIVLDEYQEKGGIIEFPILDRNGEICTWNLASEVRPPRVVKEYIFANPEISEDVRTWLGKNKNGILEEKKEEIKNE